MAAQTTPPSPIDTTSWTLIDQAGRGVPEAISRFLQLYRRAMVGHLVKHFSCQAADADDLVQGFIMDRILDAQLLAAAKREKGRFRSFLLTSLDNFVRQTRRSAAAQKRRPDSAERLDDRYDNADNDTPEHQFAVEWARDLIAHCIQTMHKECMAMGQMRVFHVLQHRLLDPCLTGAKPMSYKTMVKTFEFADPAQAYVALATAKRQFDANLRRAVREYVATDAEVEEEIKELFHALSQP